MGRDGGVRAVGRVVAAAVDLVLPVRCGGCDGADGPWCPACRDEVRASAGQGSVAVEVSGVGGDRGPPLEVYAAARFEGALRRAVSAWKDEDRSDLGPLLRGLLAVALSTALLTDPVLRASVASGARLLVVPMPASTAARRRRGGDPLGTLALEAVQAVRGPPGGGSGGPVVVRALRHRRRVADQSRLSRSERRANLRGALEVRRGGGDPLVGAVVVLVDDVVTTGATLAEAAAVVRRAGAVHVVGVTVARTPRSGVSRASVRR